VDSLIAQTYSNIEILLIDDGSTDATPAIAGKYAEQSDKVFYHHRINGGLSAARNTGISLARGEYIAFVDSDDWVDETYISCLYNTMQSAYADISVCGYIKEFEGDTKASESVSFDNDCVISSHSAMRILGDIYPKENVLLVIACNKLFRRSIFINNRFPEGRIHEDEFTAHRFIAQADSIAVTTADLYHYRIREGSITSGERKQDLRHLDYLEALQDRLERSGSMLYGDLLIYMLYTFFDGMKELMTLYTDDTIKERRLYRYFREKASRMYFKYFNDLDKYQKKDYLKLIIFPKKYRDTVIRLRKENSSE
jgi:glycosyltransferase involved in cell wall biosynthesis